jgi:Uma2 family endonuclease
MAHVSIPDERLPARLHLESGSQMTDDEYYEFCMSNPDTRFERNAEGEIIIVPPAGFESDHNSARIAGLVIAWADSDGRGVGFGSTAEFFLPTGAALSPDAGWISNRKLAQLSKEQKQKFPHVCPEFVVEVMSPSDRLRKAKEKMEWWIEGGVELAWLIDSRKRTVFVYRAGQEGGEERVGITSISGEGPVAGFELDLTKIWAGL